MSKREQHPIDTLFAGTLAQAEATPPPGAFERLMQAREASRRKRVFFWRMRLGLLILLAGAASAGILWTTRTTEQKTLDPMTAQNAHENGDTVEKTSTPPPAPNTGPDKAAQSVAVGVIQPNKVAQSIDLPAAMSTGSHTSNDPAAKGTQRPGDSPNTEPTGAKKFNSAEDPGTTAVAVGTPPAGMDLTPSAEDRTPVAMEVVDAFTVDRLVVRYPELSDSTGTAAPVHALVGQRYMLAPAHWWLGFRVGTYTGKDHWQGGDQRLAAALNAAEGQAMMWSAGLAVGREWRSGFGISAIGLYDHVDRPFRYVDRRTTVEEEVSTFVVTLNEQVFQTNADTITTVILDERINEGTHTQAGWRGGLDAYWHGTWRRWSAGPRIGLLIQQATVREGLTLDLDGTDGRVISRKLTPADRQARWPTSMLFSAALDLRYALHERWSILVAPHYMVGTGLLNTGAVLTALPEQGGLQFGLTHHFNSRR